MANTIWRFETTVLKNKSASDPAQVPTAATINFYRRGSTVSQVTTLPVTILDPDPQPTPVNVYDSGTLAVGDMLLLEGEPGAQMQVGEVTTGTSLKLLNLTQTPITLGVGSRLIVTSNPRPVAYRDVRGVAPLGNSISTDADTGRAGCYLMDSPIDYVTLVADSPAEAFTDVQGGASPRWLDARMFSGIQAAIDALPAVGGVVYVPGSYETQQTIVIPKDKAVHLVGDGPGRSVIHCADPNMDILWVKGSYSTIENLTIKGPGVGGSGRGIVLGLLASDSPTDVLRRVSIIGCEVTLTSSWALKFIDLDSPDSGAKSLSIWSHIERTIFSLNQTFGLVEIGRGNTTAVFMNCALDHFHGVGLNAYGAQRLSLIDLTFEDKKDNVSPYLVLDGVENVIISGPWFETHDDEDADKPFIYIGISMTGACRDVSILSPKFVRHKGVYPRMIRVDNNSKAIWISNPTCTLVETPSEGRFASADPALKDIGVSDGCEVHIAGGLVNKQAAPLTSLPIATSSPSRAAIVGTGPRITIPRVTPTQRDESTSLAWDRKAGDVIFNSDSEALQVWLGDRWAPVNRRGRIELVVPGADPIGGILIAGDAGLYRVSGYVFGDSPSDEVVVRIVWHDGNGPRIADLLRYTPGQPVPMASGSIVVDAVASSSIGYSLATVGQYSYSVKINVEAL